MRYFIQALRNIIWRYDKKQEVLEEIAAGISLDIMRKSDKKRDRITKSNGWEMPTQEQIAKGVEAHKVNKKECDEI